MRSIIHIFCVFIATSSYAYFSFYILACYVNYIKDRVSHRWTKLDVCPKVTLVNLPPFPTANGVGSGGASFSSSSSKDSLLRHLGTTDWSCLRTAWIVDLASSMAASISSLLCSMSNKSRLLEQRNTGQFGL